MRLLHDLARGFLVGLAGLLPGLCGSTLLVLFGIYRPLTAALAHPFRDVRAKLRQFGPFFIAAGVGVLVGSRILATFFVRHEMPTLYLFMGFMVGALPDLFRHARRTGRHPWSWLAFAALLAACLALSFWQSQADPREAALRLSWPVWLAVGALTGVGSIVPGASVAFLLIYFGAYPLLLDGVANLTPSILLPVGLGAAAAILLFARAADWLFRVAEASATCGVLGLVVGSILLVYPGYPGGKLGLLCLALFVLGALVSAALNKLAPSPQPPTPSRRG
jgi:putative membrane protein